MSQHDYVISNQDGASFRADINDALASIVSCNSGPTAPVATFAYQVWQDTATNTLKQRNGANTAWVTLLSSLGAAAAADLVTTNANLAAAQTAKAWVNFNGTGTVAIRRAFNVTSITDNAVGSYSVNFTTPMADTSYSAVVTSRRNNAADMNFSATLKPTATSGTNYPLTASSCDVICGTVTNATFIDSDVFCVAIYS